MGPGPSWGWAGRRAGAARHRHVAAVRTRRWIVGGGVGVRGHVNALISVIETQLGIGCEHSPLLPAVELGQRRRQPRSRACPILGPSHLNAQPASVPEAYA